AAPPLPSAGGVADRVAIGAPRRAGRRGERRDLEPRMGGERDQGLLARDAGGSDDCDAPLAHGSGYPVVSRAVNQPAAGPRLSDCRVGWYTSDGARRPMRTSRWPCRGSSRTSALSPPKLRAPSFTRATHCGPPLVDAIASTRNLRRDPPAAEPER